MPITVRPEKVRAAVAEWWSVSTAENLPERWLNSTLATTLPQHLDNLSNIVESSFEDRTSSDVNRVKNGFVNGVLEAYGKHHHLIIRPDDVWFAILAQLNWYINAHAEEMRGFFVAHKGQEVLSLMVQEGGFGGWAKEITTAMQEKIKDPTLREWFMPNFSTTTRTDLVVGSAIMMSTMQRYFKYSAGIICGLPSVTLLGDRKDWNKILRRLERLPEFGQEPTKWYTLLVPVLRHFVSTFDAPGSPQIRNFWSKICKIESGCTDDVTGWITAFCFWDTDGTLMPAAARNMEASDPGVELLKIQMTEELSIDWQSYHFIPLVDVPSAVASVPITVMDIPNDTKRPAMLIGGLMGYKYCNFAERRQEWLSGGQDVSQPPMTEQPDATEEQPPHDIPNEDRRPSWAPEILPRDDIKSAGNTGEKNQNQKSSGKKMSNFFKKCFCLDDGEYEQTPSPSSGSVKPVSDHGYTDSEFYPALEKPKPVQRPQTEYTDQTDGLNSIQPESGWWVFYFKPTEEDQKWSKDEKKAYKMLTGKRRASDTPSPEATGHWPLASDVELDGGRLSVSETRQSMRSPEPYYDSEEDDFESRKPVRISLQMDKLGKARKVSGKRPQSPFFGGSARARAR